MAREQTYDVFISYRRQGGAEKAELTKGELTKRGFRESRIFMDTRSITTGNYVDIIRNAVERSRSIVVIITNGCFDGLTDGSPWTREIAHAITLGKTLVPIYFDGISSIDPELLPESIRQLSLENAVLYAHQYADASFDRLTERLSKKPSVPKWGKWLLGAVAAGGIGFGGYTAMDNTSELKPGEVYIVASITSKSYHSNRNCATLKNATHRIKKTTKEEAIQQGRKPCKKCYSDATSH